MPHEIVSWLFNSSCSSRLCWCQHCVGLKPYAASCNAVRAGHTIPVCMDARRKGLLVVSWAGQGPESVVLEHRLLDGNATSTHKLYQPLSHVVLAVHVS